MIGEKRMRKLEGEPTTIFNTSCFHEEMKRKRLPTHSNVISVCPELLSKKVPLSWCQSQMLKNCIILLWTTSEYALSMKGCLCSNGKYCPFKCYFGLFLEQENFPRFLFENSLLRLEKRQPTYSGQKRVREHLTHLKFWHVKSIFSSRFHRQKKYVSGWFHHSRLRLLWIFSFTF